MTCTLTCAVGLQSVPHVAVKIVVTRQQQASALGESHGCDSADDVVVRIDHQLLIGAQIEQPAGGVVRAGGEGVAVGEELREGAAVSLREQNHRRYVSVCDTYADGIDVGLVAGEGLSAHAFPDVPQLSRSVAGPRHEQTRVRGQRQRHHVTRVTCECGRLLPSLNIPESAENTHTSGHKLTLPFFLLVLQQ